MDVGRVPTRHADPTPTIIEGRLQPEKNVVEQVVNYPRPPPERFAPYRKQPRKRQILLEYSCGSLFLCTLLSCCCCCCKINFWTTANRFHLSHRHHTRCYTDRRTPRKGAGGSSTATPSDAALRATASNVKRKKAHRRANKSPTTSKPPSSSFPGTTAQRRR